MKTMLFNPYTGKPRDPRDIASDPEGKLMLDPDEPVKAAPPATQGKCTFDEAWRGKCCVCGAQATRECDHTGQFVCGFPLCDNCEGHVDTSKSGGSWGFMNHSHRARTR